MVASGFFVSGVLKLHFVSTSQKINAANYQQKILPIYFEVMDTSIISSRRNKDFQQDRAPAHMAKSMMELLEGRV